MATDLYDISTKLKTPGLTLQVVRPNLFLNPASGKPVNGKFTGTIKRFFVQLHLITGNGDADLKGNMDLERKTYDLVSNTRSLDLGYILRQDSLFGKITLSATAKGSGFDPKKMINVFHVKMGEAEIKTYTYHRPFVGWESAKWSWYSCFFHAGSESHLSIKCGSCFSG
jgi:hypothetical protein